MHRVAYPFLSALGILLASCSSQASPPVQAVETTGVHPVSGLKVIPLTIAQNGKTHNFRVELAQSSEEQSRGLMFRTELGPDEGMIFPTQGPPQFRRFWMHNTVISLDLLFIGPDHLVSNIAADAVPYSDAPIPSSGLAIAVLEIPGGRAKELGIMPGARVTW
ncbi:DUF192 domain-containing protein [Altererythrobacter salegens]|uniref:DUF192 domain-containing protein n=1 Tax=Croceibacterium salegens TaxID=1737568 RepID=A0A6I4SV28_9SPHN|nr:DUF192 domain-containing protein [Croceibacterium salegens]MXO58937.1 DUF192 domain-containing protein [Croceibacterium salegens]